jgi:hypothetical protein
MIYSNFCLLHPFFLKRSGGFGFRQDFESVKLARLTDIRLLPRLAILNPVLIIRHYEALLGVFPVDLIGIVFTDVDFVLLPIWSLIIN